jgi:cold shock CspA family protein
VADAGVRALEEGRTVSVDLVDKPSFYAGR